MDKMKVKEDREMIIAAVESEIDLGPEKIEELTDYFNNIIISSIVNKQYKPIIEYDIDGHDNARNADNALVISANIPKDDIDNIVGAPTVDQTLFDIRGLLRSRLNTIYDINPNTFFIIMEIIGENTIKAEITIHKIYDGGK